MLHVPLIKEMGPYFETAIHTIKEFVTDSLKDNSYYDDLFNTIHPNYLLVSATVVFVFFVLYLKIKYPFWNQIPALHVYDWHRRFFYSEKPYIVHVIPKKIKYYEPRVITERFHDLDESRKTEIAKLLQNHYLPSDRVFCSVKVPDLVAQCADALISTWNKIEDEIVLPT